GKVKPTDLGDDILIGSPGLNLGQGGVYLIPGNPFALIGTFPLGSAEAQPVAATLITISNTPSTAPSFLGSAVGGRRTPRNVQVTADTDANADPILGAAGYGVTSGRGLSGGAFVIEGGLNIPVQTPVNNTIPVTIG